MPLLSLLIRTLITTKIIGLTTTDESTATGLNEALSVHVGDGTAVGCEGEFALSEGNTLKSLGIWGLLWFLVGAFRALEVL